MQHPNTTARVFNYKRTLSSLGTFDGADYLEIPQRINTARPHTLSVQVASITSNIPNVYNASALSSLPVEQRVNTGLIGISKDKGVTWTAIQLENGVYTPLNISNAINATIDTWYNDPTIPGFTIHSNSVLGVCYIILDSTKLIAGDLAVDFAYGGSKIGELLGFVGTTLFDADGTYQSDAYPKLDWFGNYVDVHIENFGSLSVIAGKSSDTAVSIKLETSTAVNSYTYPLTTGEHSYEVPVSCNESITAIKLCFTGRDSKTVVAFDGEVSVNIVLKEY